MVASLRRTCCVVALVVAAVLAPVAVVAHWAEELVGDTDAYVATVAPLADDPVVQRAVVGRIDRELQERLDVAGLTDELVGALERRGLPPRAGAALGSLVAPLTESVREFVRDHVARFVASDAFADAWARANREAHGQLVALLTGEQGGSVQVEGTAVRLNLAVVVEAVQQRLVEAGFSRAADLPPVTAEFTLVQSADVPRAQRAFRLLTATATALPFVVAGLLAVAVACAVRRRRAVVMSALAVAGSMVVLALLLQVVRLLYLDQTTAPPDAAGVVFDQLLAPVRTVLRVVLTGAVVVALVAWATGRWPVRRGPAAG